MRFFFTKYIKTERAWTVSYTHLDVYKRQPTNHLDVDAKEALKNALIEYKGSILLICHEPEFYRDVVGEVWDMSRWTTKIF